MTSLIMGYSSNACFLTFILNYDCLKGYPEPRFLRLLKRKKLNKTAYIKLEKPSNLNPFYHLNLIPYLNLYFSYQWDYLRLSTTVDTFSYLLSLLGGAFYG